MKRTSTRVRQITDASIICAIYCAFFLLSRLSGSLLEYDLFFVLPIPIALYAYKYGFKISIIPLFATTILSVFICTTPFSSFVYILPSLLIGSIFGGILIQTKMKAVFIILIITGIALVSEILSSIVLSSMLNIENIFKEIEWIVNGIAELAPKLNLFGFDVPFFQAILEGLIPAILILISLIDAVLIYLLFNLIIMKTKMFRFYVKRQPFSFMVAPIWLSISFIILLPIAVFSFMHFEDENMVVHVLYIIAINVFLIFSLIYVYFGMKTAILFTRYVNKGWLIIIVYLFVLIPPFQLFLILLGVIDSFYGISKRIIERIRINNSNEKQ